MKGHIYHLLRPGYVLLWYWRMEMLSDQAIKPTNALIVPTTDFEIEVGGQLQLGCKPAVAQNRAAEAIWRRYHGIPEGV